MQRDRRPSIKVDQWNKVNGERSDVWQLFAPEGVADNVDNDHLKTLILFFFLSALPPVSASFTVANGSWIQVTAQASEFVGRLHALKILASLTTPPHVLAPDNIAQVGVDKLVRYSVRRTKTLAAECLQTVG